MNLSDLATHVCQLVGMFDTDDIAAAKMFLQRRLEMIWNTQLWRASLLEATMTISTDGTVDLADTVWIPSRGTLLLPPEFDFVMAVRQSGHAMNVASLESYYRTDADFLSMTGDSTQFQVLSPLVWEFDDTNSILVLAEASDAAKVGALRYNTNGVSKTELSQAFGLSGMEVTVRQIFSLTKAATDSAVSVQQALTNKLTVTSGGSGAWGGNYTQASNGNYVNDDDALWIISWSGTRWEMNEPGGDLNYYCSTLTGAWLPGIGDAPVPAVVYQREEIISIEASKTSARPRQRIRLTSIPATEVGLRVLGKCECPTLGDYDVLPINNAELCLMAFARADMLMRQRQHGKSQLAQSEGAALLKQLADSEAFQQANNHRVIPDSGYGEASFSHYPGHSQPFN